MKAEECVMESSMLKIIDLSFSYDGKREVFSGINLDIKAGECIGLIGANGVGKSTLLKLIVGLEFAKKGKIIVNNMEVNSKNLREVRKNIGYVFQDSDAQLFMPTVHEDVKFALLNYGYGKDEADQIAYETLKKIGIENLKDQSIYHLSGGQKKLVSIATVLVLNPDMIIFDEPTVCLDPKNRRKFMEVLRSLGGTKIVASHDLDLIYDTCDRSVLIADQRIVKEGITQKILTDRELLENNGLELPLSMISRNKMSVIM